MKNDSRPLACATRWPRRLLLAVVFFALGAAPLALWMIRNHWLGGTLTGPRSPARFTLQENLTDAAETLNGWFLPGDVGELVGAWGWLSIAVAAVGLAGLGVMVFLAARLPEPRQFLCRVLPWVCMAAVFLTMMIAAPAMTKVDRLGDRLLSPLLIPLVMTLLLSTDRLVHAASSEARVRRRRAAATIGFAALFVLAALQGGKGLGYLAREGQGYTSRYWRARSLLSDLAALPPDARIITNQPALVRCLTGRPAERSPRQGEPMPQTAAFLAWFGDDYPPPPDLMPIERLQETINLDPLVERADGTLYRLKWKTTRPGGQ